MNATWEPSVRLFLSYLQDVRRLSPHTLRAYQSDITVATEFFSAQGAAHPGQVTTEMLRAFLSKERSRGRSPRSISRRLSALRSFFGYLQQTHQLDENPVMRVRSPKLPQTLPRALDPKVRDALFEAPSVAGSRFPKRDQAIVELLYGAGLRVAEAAALHLSDLDLQDRWVTVMGKGNKQRRVPFGRAAARALQAYLREERPQLARGKATSMLFLSQRGTALTTRSIRRIVDRVGRAAGEGHIVPHALRHTYASDLLRGGADLKTVQELLGHARLTTTAIYTKVADEELRRHFEAAHPLAGPKDAAREKGHNDV